jgi:hypothetical protein
VDLSTLLTGTLGVLALLSLIASAAAIAKANYAKSTIETLEKSNAALTGRVKILEDESVRKDTLIASLASENLALQTYVSGTDAIKALALTLATNDIARTKEHHDILAAIETIPVLVTAHNAEVLALLHRTTHTHLEAAS